MGYSEWGEWSFSLAECGTSVITRRRECINKDGCSGVDTHKKTIYLDPCPGKNISVIVRFFIENLGLKYWRLRNKKMRLNMVIEAAVRKDFFIFIFVHKIGVLKPFHNIHRKTPALGSLFNKGCNFIKKRLQRRCFPVNTASF